MQNSRQLLCGQLVPLCCLFSFTVGAFKEIAFEISELDGVDIHELHSNA